MGKMSTSQNRLLWVGCTWKPAYIHIGLGNEQSTVAAKTKWFAEHYEALIVQMRSAMSSFIPAVGDHALYVPLGDAEHPFYKISNLSWRKSYMKHRTKDRLKKVGLVLSKIAILVGISILISMSAKYYLFKPLYSWYIYPVASQLVSTLSLSMGTAEGVVGILSYCAVFMSLRKAKKKLRLKEGIDGALAKTSLRNEEVELKKGKEALEQTREAVKTIMADIDGLEKAVFETYRAYLPDDRDYVKTVHRLFKVVMEKDSYADYAVYSVLGKWKTTDLFRDDSSVPLKKLCVELEAYKKKMAEKTASNVPRDYDEERIVPVFDDMYGTYEQMTARNKKDDATAKKTRKKANDSLVKQKKKAVRDSCAAYIAQAGSGSDKAKRESEESDASDSESESDGEGDNETDTLLPEHKTSAKAMAKRLRKAMRKSNMTGEATVYKVLGARIREGMSGAAADLATALDEYVEARSHRGESLGDLNDKSGWHCYVDVGGGDAETPTLTRMRVIYVHRSVKWLRTSAVHPLVGAATTNGKWAWSVEQQENSNDR
jgi:hypothetical protein